jgi:hypothetical protein
VQVEEEMHGPKVHSRAHYRVNASRALAGKKRILPSDNSMLMNDDIVPKGLVEIALETTHSHSHAAHDSKQQQQAAEVANKTAQAQAVQATVEGGGRGGGGAGVLFLDPVSQIVAESAAKATVRVVRKNGSKGKISCQVQVR